MMQHLPSLRISSNGRFLVTSDGHPFFWLGDTAWEMLHRLSLEETRHYFNNRKKKGFSIIQTVILAELDGLQTPNANGHLPLNDLDPRQPNEAYFDHVDRVVSLAEEMGLYLGLLPTWGDKFNKKWGTGPEIFTAENAKSYGRFLASRYGRWKHIVWILGGDRIPENKQHKLIIEEMATGIREGHEGALISYHPNGGYVASDLFGKASWLDIDLFQTRHQKGFREYRFTLKARKRKPTRPVIDGEPGYENIPNLLNKWNFQRLDAADIRRSAYWNMLSGAAGYSYGCNEIWQMYGGTEAPKFGAQFSWKEALDLPGAHQMGILKRLFESIPWQEMAPDPKVLAEMNWIWQPRKLVLSTADRDWILVYCPGSQKIKLKAGLFRKIRRTAFWINPVNGEVKRTDGDSGPVFSCPDKNQDWLLLVLLRQAADQWDYSGITLTSKL
ncbi:Putative collagen-binding domain of a collagenase [Cyclobacterium lianum]|uniref:Putative collagen-binding domain of a collagenase n=1 Tax=Cyclobacterium lianum TaxID=388280 RepID=A0A1M7HTJ7_9BACT|nr:DUF4038 domain-containing protein [Cyclobacterium lianum]SHM31738.1 Putative collagen-binding domain of a collagenase [Cyclobacterium lianum]